MVKFGRHQQFFVRNEHAGSDLYVVPYNAVKQAFIILQHAEQEDDHDASAAIAASFETEWRACLDRAMADFDRATQQSWTQVFDGIAALSQRPEEARGALPERALRLYMSLAAVADVQELLKLLKDIYSTAVVNAEALRKLVKKFDKAHHHSAASTSDGHHLLLCPKLLPQVYSANFTVGQPTIEQEIALIRDHLGLMDDDELISEEHHPAILENEDDEPNKEGGGFMPFFGRAAKKNSIHKEQVKRRKSELQWLRKLTSSIQSEMGHVVAHRGFHCPLDESVHRPLENSIQAYEAAWSNGVHLCECDIALTKDERLVLAHDEDFSRLALDSDSPLSNTKVRDLTWKELLSSVPLSSGSRPPLLLDVLESAHTIGGDSKLIIEIKPGNVDAGSALARMFFLHPDELMACCAVVMSFDAFAMRTFQRELAHVLLDKTQKEAANSEHDGGNIMREQLQRTSRTRMLSMTTSAMSIMVDHANLNEILTKPTTITKRPKLMLLTVCDPPKKDCELYVDVSDLSPVDGWLSAGDGKFSLDGVYLQFQKEMLESQGLEALQQLSKKYNVGVWGHNGRDPDDYETFRRLVKDGHVTYVNSDLPRTFKVGM